MRNISKQIIDSFKQDIDDYGFVFTAIKWISQIFIISIAIIYVFKELIQIIVK